VAALLIDTDILADYLRGRADAVSFVDGLVDAPALSVLTVAELFAGIREGPERQALEAVLDGCDLIEVDAAIAREGGLLRRRYHPSHGVGIVDAMIAATALAHGLRLATRNRKHFPMLPDLVVPY
jgi:predicted nucleic acid-binding protein